ncbi:uncharacterized protein PFL1_00611 [Pseudozyma flocculosa PF-1]|uniref:LysM domain-containing protein n=1 Tax=Pseudozyma flocculosa TaxID=84751 RepID=A0A5C3EQG4_9BASI|nr:uncharacterized protein PFL1_00611 [Pseudozyma flocculosa PF-1]EPQ32415.1 hypothetical protein PFL1_00611 [Pseudozyma flocculosa PF-1]SPO34604.1 uncharacterized protein PSFLO_00075 [Pseudozyma flocculosa]
MLSFRTALAASLVPLGALAAFHSNDTACTRHYTVQAGDTCDTIGQKTLTSTYQILALNLLEAGSDCYTLEVGRKLCLGRFGNDCQFVHRCTNGDTCDSIAAQYGISQELLQDNNPILDCDIVYDGLVLCVTPGSVRPPADSSINSTAIRIQREEAQQRQRLQRIQEAEDEAKAAAQKAQTPPHRSSKKGSKNRGSSKEKESAGSTGHHTTEKGSPKKQHSSEHSNHEQQQQKPHSDALSHGKKHEQGGGAKAVEGANSHAARPDVATKPKHHDGAAAAAAAAAATKPGPKDSKAVYEHGHKPHPAAAGAAVGAAHPLQKHPLSDLKPEQASKDVVEDEHVKANRTAPASSASHLRGHHTGVNHTHRRPAKHAAAVPAADTEVSPSSS